MSPDQVQSMRPRTEREAKKWPNGNAAVRRRHWLEGRIETVRRVRTDRLLADEESEPTEC